MAEERPDRIPPVEVAAAAEKGLKLRAQYRRGGTTAGIARAKDLKNRKPVSEQTIRKMVSYFSRHRTEKRADNFGDEENASTGYIAWLLWGGDLKNRKPVSEQTIRKMVSYFSRHRTEKRADNFGDEENASTGYIAWLLWGGDAGAKWAEQHKKALDKAKEEAKMRRFRPRHQENSPNP